MKVGDYVRTRDGNIAKYIGYDGFYNFDNYVLDETKGINNDLLNEIVIKSSPNIIELVQKGDYVNEHRVIGFMLENNKRKGIIVDANIWGFDIDEIKSIVTKEQFESMEYKIGE